MADGITFDKASYKPGDLARVRVEMAGRRVEDEIKFATVVGNLTTTTIMQAEGTLTHTLPGAIKLIDDNGTVANFTIQY